MASASRASDSYKCGSELGSVMIEVTSAWSPPIWAAMLPQKFSAATTLTFPFVTTPLGCCPSTRTKPTPPITSNVIVPMVNQSERRLEGGRVEEITVSGVLWGIEFLQISSPEVRARPRKYNRLG